ncbi:MAG: cache domain-containing protein [Anaerolineae bacterium]
MFSLRPRFTLFLFLLLFIALLPLAILIGTQVLAAPPAPRQEATRVAAEVDRLFKMRMSEVFTLAALPSMRAYASSDITARPARAPVAMNELQALVAADTQVREAFIVDLEGNPILGTGDAIKVIWGNRTFVQRALAGQLDVSPIVHEMNEYSQYYAAPILDGKGDVAGVFVIRVAAQELWGTVNGNSDPPSGQYAVLVDENGIRLADGGDMARNLAALGPLATDLQARIIREQTYGAQVLAVRTTQFTRAQEAVSRGFPEALQPADLGVQTLAIHRLSTRPWTVLFVVASPSPREFVVPYILPVVAAIVAAGAVALWLTR